MSSTSRMLREHLPAVLDTANADMVFYLAGVDVAAGDRYGKLDLTEEGIRQRDRAVIEAVRNRGCLWSSCWRAAMRPRGCARRSCMRMCFAKRWRMSVKPASDRCRAGAAC
jgi:hypothetical protein